MTSPWTISASTDRVRLDPQRQAEATFTITNPGPVDIRAVFDVLPGDNADRAWFTVDEPQQRIVHGGSSNIAVKIAVPPKAPPGSYWLAGRVYSADTAPEETSTVSDRVAFDVAPAPAPAPSRPKWLLLIPVGVLVLAVVGVAVWLLTRGSDTVEVPSLVGEAEPAASQRLAERGLSAQVSRAFNNGTEADRVFDQEPDAGARVEPGSRITVSVSNGKRPAAALLDLAPATTYRSAAGGLPFGSSDVDDRGFVLIRQGSQFPLEDGSGPDYLEMHPQWISGGFVEGDFALTEPFIAGDHFRATVGFMAGSFAGDADFVVLTVSDNGATTELHRVRNVAGDGQLTDIDIDLSRAAGLRVLRLRVEAGTTSAQDWAVWVNPRVEG
jgi:PASTA domain/NPCBM/NEW2 domain